MVAVDMTARVTKALARRAEGVMVSPPTLPNGVRVKLPEKDGRAPMPATRPVAPIVGMAFVIEYADAKGEKSRRRITMRDIYPHRGDLLIDALCHERKASRRFLASRIRSLMDPNTGEVIDDAEDLIAHVTDMSRRNLRAISADPAKATWYAQRRARRGYNVLVFISRCDGLHPSEPGVIVDYMATRFADLTLDKATVARQMNYAYPDSICFDQALRGLRLDGAEEVRRLARSVKAMIDADGVMSEAEFDLAMRLKEALAGE